MRRAQPAGLASKWLPWMIRLTALGYLFFFVPDLLLATTHRIQGLPPVLARLFDWGNGGDAVAVMFATVYIVWAIFLFGSARKPLTHRLFLDFNLTANAAHFTAMLIMALTMPEHHDHTVGVIALECSQLSRSRHAGFPCGARHSEPSNQQQRRCPSDAMIVRLSRCLSSCTAVPAMRQATSAGRQREGTSASARAPVATGSKPHRKVVDGCSPRSSRGSPGEGACGVHIASGRTVLPD